MTDTQRLFELDCEKYVANVAEELEAMDDETLNEYLYDVYDIEYRADNERAYRSVKLMIACGGPNVYVDTDEKAVLLHWGGTKKEHFLSREVTDRVDNIFSELWDCN